MNDGPTYDQLIAKARHVFGRDPTPEGLIFCPVCDPDGNVERTLTLADRNGNGPLVECSNGCSRELILKWLARLAGQPQRFAPDDPKDLLRATLKTDGPRSITKHGRHGSSYVWEQDDGRKITLGTVRQLFDPRHVEAQFLGQARVLIPDFTRPKWRPIAGFIEQAAVERNTVTSDQDETRTWIAHYLYGGHNLYPRIIDPSDKADLLRALTDDSGPWPFRDTEGRLWLRSEPLLDHVNRMPAVKTSLKELTTRLSELDFEAEQPTRRLPGGKTPKARYWVSPPGFEGHLTTDDNADTEGDVS